MSERKLSRKDKLNLIKDSKSKDRAQLSSKYGCSISTVHRILQISHKIAKWGIVEQLLSMWQSERRGPVTRKSILDKAKELAGDVRVEFNPSWLERWQRRERKETGMDEQMLDDTSDDSDGELHAAGDDSTVPEPKTDYKPRDIFAAKEISLYFRMMPLSSLRFITPECPEYTGCKERLTVLLICNGIGTYKKAIVIGKPTHGSQSKDLPLQYITQSNASMNHVVWSDILVSFDKEMAKAGRKIKLYVDNTLVQLKYGTLKNINLQLLSPNDTSLKQPLGEDIIRIFKTHYRSSVSQKQNALMESGRPLQDFVKEFGIQEAVHFINTAWQLIPPDLITAHFESTRLIPLCNGPFPLIDECKIIPENFISFIGIDAWNRLEEEKRQKKEARERDDGCESN